MKCLLIRLSFLTAIVVAGCASAPRPYTFTTAASKPSALDALAQGLIKDGHRVGSIDRTQGSIVTYWEDTGYRWRETDDLEEETNVFLRFHVQLSPTAAGQSVAVTAHVQRCVPYQAAITPSEVRSTCLKMDGILPSHQTKVDELGTTLSTALSAGAPLPGRRQGG